MPDPIKPTAAIRNAAADHINAKGRRNTSHVMAIRQGQNDGHPLVQLLASIDQQAREQALEEAAKVAEWAHMVPPDGGSPSEAECEVARNAAAAIRALKEQRQ